MIFKNFKKVEMNCVIFGFTTILSLIFEKKKKKENI